MTINRLRLFIIAHVSTGEGFSINALGEKPTKGYMTGFNKSELIGANLTQGDIDKWVDDNYQTLMGDHNLYVGGWQDGDLYYLEISKRFDDMTSALTLAEAHNQKAIWDVEEKTSSYLR